MEINTTLENLKDGKSQRTRDSLDRLNTLLEDRFKKGEKDYSIATIGRISKEKGGVGEVSIRNKSGEHFRLLIDAWANKARTTMKKPPVAHSRKNNIPNDMEILMKLDDPALRAVFGQIIAENKKLKRENSVLKAKTEVIIDLRPNQVVHTVCEDQVLLPSLKNVLVKSEIEALEDAIKDEKMVSLGWKISSHGAVKDINNRPVFKIGFISAIQKILKQI